MRKHKIFFKRSVAFTLALLMALSSGTSVPTAYLLS